MSTLLRIEALKDLVQEAVDAGARSVEEIHRTIADLPFAVLDERGLLDDAAAAVRDTSQKSIGGIYDAIRRINREVGDLASHILEAIDDHAVARERIEALEARGAEPAADDDATEQDDAATRPARRRA